MIFGLTLNTVAADAGSDSQPKAQPQPQSKAETAIEIAAPNAKLEKLAGDFVFTEGASCDAKGNVFFTDQPNDRIWKWSTDDKLSSWMEPSGRSNGTCFDAKGNLWTCADEKNELWRIDPKGQVTVVARDYDGKLLNGPNDVWPLPNGGAYVTDPFYKRDWWGHDKSEQESEAVYYIAPGHEVGEPLLRVASDLNKPNGIVGTPDGQTLYVADIGADKTYRYETQSDGSLKNKTLFCDLGSDGMTMDNEGNVYLTGDGVSVFDKTGRQIKHIPVPENWTGNICFGGKDFDTLFITASKGLYALKMRVKAAGSQ